VSKSGLVVLNCCGAGRWPAYVSDPTAYASSETLQLTQGVNVLCAECLPGYSSVNGHCIACDNVQVGALLAVLMLATLLVWLVHRLPHDWTGQLSWHMDTDRHALDAAVTI
jgi:hypothetical protein